MYLSSTDPGWDHEGQYPNARDEHRSLESQVSTLKEQLEFVQKRLKDLQVSSETTN
jgi:hypothetical protein